MRKLILLALPLATLLLMAGCDQYQSSSGYNSAPRSTQTAPATASSTTATVQQQTYQPSRSTTTQPLPQGYGYIHEADLTGGRLPAGQPAPVVRSGGS